MHVTPDPHTVRVIGHASATVQTMCGAPSPSPSPSLSLPHSLFPSLSLSFYSASFYSFIYPSACCPRAALRNHWGVAQAQDRLL